jgi:hypothetical protein
MLLEWMVKGQQRVNGRQTERREKNEDLDQGQWMMLN